ncbi:MAG TPA: NAD(P)-dependent oxidoreductase [Opitutaceae bacterium]|nr:NAD(P)-dependent oxidoreductase [Opitutaceae bacterium]
MNKTIGVIGLGIIGGIWARHYAAADRLAGSWNRTPQPQAPAWKNSPEEVVVAADVIQIVVADPPAVEAILQKILPRLGPDKVVMQSSTIDPVSNDNFAAQVTARGARYLAAPFTGSKPAAEQKQVVFFLGGDAPLVAEMEPLLALVSAHRFHVGTGAQAAALKLALNLNIAAQMEGLCEALVMARRAEISDDVFFRVLEKNVAYSSLAKFKETKLRTGDFSPQFSVKHMHKDMRLAAETAGPGRLPLLEAIREQLRRAEERGGGDEDLSAVLKLL